MTYSLILRRTLLAASAAALCLPAMAELAEIKTAGKLRVGIDFGAPFYGFVDDKMKPIAGSEFQLKADLVLLAMGFVAPVREGMLDDLALALDARGNVKASERDYSSSQAKVYACGDMRRGQSLVVWAIREGRQCAASIDKALMGATVLPR